MPHGTPASNYSFTILSFQIRRLNSTLPLFNRFTLLPLSPFIKPITHRCAQCFALMASACASSAVASAAISTPSSQKNGCVLGTRTSFLSGRKLRVNKFAEAVGGRSVSSSVRAAAADPDRPLWFPGSTPPPWLDGSLPGDFGFDPLGLGWSSFKSI